MIRTFYSSFHRYKKSHWKGFNPQKNSLRSLQRRIILGRFIIQSSAHHLKKVKVHTNLQSAKELSLLKFSIYLCPKKVCSQQHRNVSNFTVLTIDSKPIRAITQTRVRWTLNTSEVKLKNFMPWEQQSKPMPIPLFKLNSIFNKNIMALLLYNLNLVPLNKTMEWEPEPDIILIVTLRAVKCSQLLTMERHFTIITTTKA